jgi:hypothetical protein
MNYQKELCELLQVVTLKLPQHKGKPIDQGGLTHEHHIILQNILIIATRGWMFVALEIREHLTRMPSITNQQLRRPGQEFTAIARFDATLSCSSYTLCPQRRYCHNSGHINLYPELTQGIYDQSFSCPRG